MASAAVAAGLPRQASLRHRLLLAAAALLVFVGALLVFFPASLALRMFGQPLPPLVLADVGGTLWDGRAARTIIADRDLGTLRWRLHPLSLLRGARALDVTLAGVDMQASASIVLAGTTIDLHALHAELPATVLQGVLAPAALQPQGRVLLDVPQARFEAMLPRVLHGTVVWRDAAVVGLAAAGLGELVSEFGLNAEGQVVGTLADRGGPLVLDGGYMLGHDGYRAQARLAARDPARNPALADALRWIGQPDADGRRQLIVQGVWIGAPQ